MNSITVPKSSLIYDLDKEFEKYKIPKNEPLPSEKKKENMNIRYGFGKIKYFNTIAQYDKEIENKSGNLCSLFSLITANNFMKNGDTSRTVHEKNLKNTSLNFEINEIKDEMAFNDLLQYSNLSKSKIGVMLNESINYLELFPKITKYCTIIFKNSKFFVIEYETMRGYFIRDCNELVQYNFVDLQDLIYHLESVYQFSKKVIVDEGIISNFNIIEYIIIDNTFKMSERIFLDLIDNTNIKILTAHTSKDDDDIIDDNYNIYDNDIINGHNIYDNDIINGHNIYDNDMDDEVPAEIIEDFEEWNKIKTGSILKNRM